MGHFLIKLLLIFPLYGQVNPAVLDYSTSLTKIPQFVIILGKQKNQKEAIPKQKELILLGQPL